MTVLTVLVGGGAGVDGNGGWRYGTDGDDVGAGSGDGGDVGGGAVVHVVFQDGNAKCWV